jgi:hypothetical protein
MAEISDALKLVIRQRGGGKRISMEVYLCHTSANFLLWRSQEDGNLNVATDTIVVVVFLVDNRLLVAENSISFSFDKMAYVDTTTVRDTFQSLDIERQREKWERKAKKASEGNGDTKRRSASTSSWLYWLPSERDLPECHKVNGIRTRLHPLAYP